MMNGTTIRDLEKSEDNKRAQSFKLPVSGLYEIAAQRDGKLGQWITAIADVAFTDLECYPAEDTMRIRSRRCSYTDPHYTIKKQMSLKKRFNYKYLPDIDGNAYSGQWRSLLMSTSLPMKSTLYAEWHDDRLVPWVHFVPFDNIYQDLYGIMDYFLHGRDHIAQRIALEGSNWSRRVLRRDDMLLYVWRLLLEFARVSDEKRYILGYVDDLLSKVAE